MLSTDNMPVFSPHVGTANIVTLPVANLQVELIGTTFGIADLPMDGHALKAKEAEAHAKEAKAHASELVQMEARSPKATEKGA